MSKSELKLNCLFEDINEFILPNIFENIEFPWEVFGNSKKIMAGIVDSKDSKIESKIHSSSYIDGWVSIGENTQISNNVTIEGPAIIGDNCKISSGSLIRPGSIISNNCSIGHGSEIKNSLIFNGAKIASLCFVGDSIIGKSARVGSGTITANRRFDQKNIGLKLDGEYFDFGTDFFGCILGDYSRIGANCTTLPGTIIGPFTWILPLTRIGKFIPSQKVVGSEHNLIMKDNEIIKLND